MRYLIAGHGDYAQGVVNTLKFFKDDLNNVDLLPYNNDFEQQLQAYLDRAGSGGAVVRRDGFGRGQRQSGSDAAVADAGFLSDQRSEYFVVIGNVVFRSERRSADRGNCERGEGSDGLRQRHDGSAV